MIFPEQFKKNERKLTNSFGDTRLKVIIFETGRQFSFNFFKLFGKDHCLRHFFFKANGKNGF